MNNEEGPDSDASVLVEAQRIRMDKARSANPSDKDVQVLAEAKRIRDDEGRSEAVRKHMRGRKADVFAEKPSFAGKLKARREAIEAGDPEGAREVFIK